MSYSSCLYNNRRVQFILNVGTYQNIIRFLEVNNILFLAEMSLDFTQIPTILHGKGVSKNLLEYLSNNTLDSDLILNFLKYFLSIVDIKYSNNENLRFEFLENLEWQNMYLKIFIPYMDLEQWPDGFMYNETLLYDWKIWYN